MTAYTASVNSGALSGTLGLQAVNFDIRVVGGLLIVNSYAGTNVAVSFSAFTYVYQGPLSGGTAVTAVPYRDGSPAASTLVLSGASGTGTQFILENNQGHQTTGVPTTFDVIVQQGHSILMQGSRSTGSGSFFANFTWEELRLSWHF